MIELPEIGVHLHIVSDVVHPAHVPFQIEAQAALADRVGHQGPGGGLLGDHQHVVVLAEDPGVELPDEIHGLQILVSAVDVGGPLPSLAAVVQIEHGGHRVHPKAVDVEHLQPEQGGGVQEGSDLVLAVVKDPRTPVGVLPFAHVGVLVAGLAVELVQAEGVLGKVGRDPVQNDAHPGLVELVHQVHEVLWGAEAAGGREVAGTLVAPGVVQGMLGDGHQLHVGEAHLLDVGHQVLGYVPVREELPLPRPAPGAQVDLIDVEGLLVDRVLLPPVQPAPVPPCIAAQLIELGGGTGPGLGVEGIGIGFEQHPAVRRLHGVLVEVVLPEPGDKALPDAPLQRFHGVAPGNPLVEIAHHRHGRRVGRPDPEHMSRPPLALRRVGAHVFPGPDGLAAGVFLYMLCQLRGGPRPLFLFHTASPFLWYNYPNTRNSSSCWL